VSISLFSLEVESPLYTIQESIVVMSSSRGKMYCGADSVTKQRRNINCPIFMAMVLPNFQIDFFLSK